MKYLFSIFLFLTTHLSALYGQDLLGKWKMNSEVDERGVTKEMMIRFDQKDSAIIYLTATVDQSVFCGIVPGKYQIKDDQLYLSVDINKISIVAQLYDNTFVVPKHHFISWLWGIDSERLYNAFAAYFITLPVQTTIKSLSNDTIVTTEWTLTKAE